MASKLEQLKQMTDVVADTGDMATIRQFTPQDATTNPSLLLKAAALTQYQDQVAAAREFGARFDGPSADQENAACDRFGVLIGQEITRIVPGRVSTEVDARLSFDAAATQARATGLINAYETLGVPRDRILIKIAATWEGIQAAEALERRGINCNLTLLFSFEQAVACANAGVYLISPFVGRILDWHQNATGDRYTAENDPGVLSVQRIYRYYKNFGFDTVVMGASFRNLGEIEALAGCDRLTISPALLEELASDHSDMPRRLSPDDAAVDNQQGTLSEASFRWSLNGSAMATEKLAEGIRTFAQDQAKLAAILAG